MRNIIIISLSVIALYSCSNRHRQKKYEPDEDCVYVCTGEHAKRYHAVSDCKGLTSCSEEIIEMTIEDAEGEDKTPCKMCIK